jgi:tRNA-splicing ligase RtcB
VEDAVLEGDVWGNPFLYQLKNRARIYMADQGDGNHFAYIGEMEVTPDLLAVLRPTGHAELAGNLALCVSKTLRVLVTHHASRSIGAHLYKCGQNAAEKDTAKVAEGMPKASA